MALASGVMALAVAALTVALTDGAGLDPGQNRDALIVLVLASTAGGLTYLLASLALDLDEPRQLALRVPLLRWFLAKA
jgi:hypothetical protein